MSQDQYANSGEGNAAHHIDPGTVSTSDANNNNNNNTGSANNEGERIDREATKRLAQQGQWRTPPLPVFAASAAGSASAAAASTAASASKNSAVPTTTSAGVSSGAPVNGVPPILPTTPDEYARMLHEAYRRGAEAGARAQVPSTALPHAQMTSSAPVPQHVAPPQHGHPTDPDKVGNSDSCPNLEKLSVNAAPINNNVNITPHPSRSTANSTIVTGMPPPPTVQYMVPPHLPSPLTSPMHTSTNHNVPLTTASSAGVAIAPSSTGAGPIAVHATNYSMPSAPAPGSIPATHAHANTQYHPTKIAHNSHAPHHHAAQHSAMAAGSEGGVAVGNRSVSLPDMSSYAAHANDEEEKRKKRLARNRASARLRRLKKKNLVSFLLIWF